MRTAGNPTRTGKGDHHIPGAKGTEVARINDRGQLVGNYSQDTPIVNDSARVRGYLWDRGKVTRIDAPGAVGTTALGVNNRAQVVGAYWNDDGTAHGYVWERGRMTTIDVPGAFATSRWTSTTAARSSATTSTT